MSEQEKDPGLKKASFIFLIILGVTIGFFLPRPIIVWPWNYISSNEAVQKISEFLREEMAEEDITIELLSIEEDHNLYRLKLKIGEQYFLSYMTKDGKLLFPSMVNLSPPREQLLPQNNKPSIDLFVMALSPLANTVEKNIIEAVNLFQGKVDFNIHYVVSSDLEEGKCLDEESLYCSERGVPEVNQTMRELCVAKYYPEKLSDFILSTNNLIDEGDLENSILEYEERGVNEIMTDLELDEETINQCVLTEGQNLLEEQMALSQKKYQVRLPEYYVDSFGEYQTESVVSRVGLALIVNDMIYGQAEELYYLSPEDYRGIICQSFLEKQKPEICSTLEDIPEEELPKEEPSETSQEDNL